MGKFDLDDVLSDLESLGGGAAPANGASDGADAPGEFDGFTVAGSEDTDPAPAFVRPDPSETPRPPDLTGSGLGEEVNPGQALARVDPAQVRPDDALAAVYIPGDGEAGAELAELGSFLLARQAVDPEKLTAAERVMKQTPGRRLSSVLVEMGVDEVRIQKATAEINTLPFERIDSEASGSYDLKLLERLGLDFCKDNMIIPIRREGKRLVVGTLYPDDVFVLDEVKRRLGVWAIKHVLAPAQDLLAIFELHTDTETQEYDVDEILSDVDEDDIEVVKEDASAVDAEEAESSPVVRYVNHIIQTAMKEGASDIHIEPEEKVLKVRFRVDGILFEMMNPPKKMHSAITSRIKIMANLDIAERRLPQDGRIRITVHGRKLDLRVSTLPTARGEKTVLRILDTRSINVPLENLGFGETTLQLWAKQIAQPHGIILVTGPTGSGKTTTLYASLRQMDCRKLNVSTVEDPVEYQIDGITQTQTHERIGMTFGAALKSLLRQDPDVVMLGEIRDMETATIAIQASLTGHLVLSTLHTNDAPSSITRLINIGIESFLVAAALNAVLAQRLTRRICENCKKPSELTPELEEFLVVHGVTIGTAYDGAGCPRCRETGYAGRVGLYEMLILDDFLRDKIAASPNVTEFRRACCERGMVSLREDGFEKVSRGMTTIEEILRVTQSTI